MQTECWLESFFLSFEGVLGFKEVLKTNLGDWGREVDDGISEGVHHWAKIRATSSLIK